MTKVDLEGLKELGFDTAVSNVEKSKELVRKSAVAYEHFDYVTQEDVDKFIEEVKGKTKKEFKDRYTYDTLKFISIKEYTEVPPADVLEKLREAKKWNCFDTFEIGKIESVVEVKDPILFGRVNECGDRFFIAQWDNDVTIEAIHAANKGK